MKLIDVHCAYIQLFETLEDYQYAPKKVKDAFRKTLSTYDTLTYIDDNDQYVEGDVVLVPYGTSFRVGLVAGDSESQVMDETIHYKKVICKCE